MPTGAGGGSSAPKGWPLTFYNAGQPAVLLSLGAVNQVYINGFVLSYQLTFTNFFIRIGTNDGTNLYDMGIYTKAGALIANIGAQHLPTTGYQTFATLQGAQTINPGLYVFAWTGNATTAQLVNTTSITAWANNSTYVASVGGALPASITAVPVAPVEATIEFNLY